MSETSKAPPAKRRWSKDDYARARELALEHLRQFDADVLPQSAESAITAEVQTPPPPRRSPAEPQRYGPLFRAAAICAQFRIETLANAGSEPAEIERLEAASTELTIAGPGLRTLNPDVRNDVLRQMTRDEIQTHLAAAMDQTDPFHRALRLALDGVRGEELLQYESNVLLTLLQLYDGLSPNLSLPPREEIERELELGRLLEPLRQLTRTFSGRAAELQRLRDYVGVVPPSTLLGRIARAVTSAFQPVRKPPLLVYGPGGVGKTTLVARFILEHAVVASKLQFPFVYLDFDRPTVSDTQTSTLLIEAVRQIGLQFGSAYAASAEFRKRWERSLRRTSSSGDYLDPDLFENFVIFLDTLELRDGPVLMVLDTFEEVQLRSRSYESGVIEVMNRLSERVPRLRVVIAGRSRIEGFAESQQLSLSQFDRDAAIAYLVAHGVTPDAAADIYRVVGGSPLTLTLGLDIYRRDPKELRDRPTFRVDAAQLQSEVIQLQLFDRVLLHVRNSDVRKLVHPGLVMRRITPEAILEVLAGPCEIAVRDLAHADELFDELAKDATLVERRNPDERVVWQRQDVRHLMLRPLRRDARAKVNEIHRLAIAYYQKQEGLEVRTEEVYHRLALGQSREQIAPLVDPDMRDALIAVLDEFDPPEQALISDLFGIELTPEARHAADQLSWERSTSRRLKEAIRANTDLQSVLGLLHEREERSGSTDLLLSEVMLYEAIDDDFHAKALADSAIVTYRTVGHVDYLLVATLLAARLEQDIGNDQAAVARLSEAEEIARRKGDAMALARVLRHRCAYLRVAEEEVPEPLRIELAENIARVTDAEWSADLALLRGVAEEIGRSEPAIVERALRLGALELSRSGLETIRSMFGKSLSELTIDAPVADAVLTLLRNEDEQRRRRKASRGKRDTGPSLALTLSQRNVLRDLLTKYYGSRLSELAFSRLGVGLESVSFGTQDPLSTAADLIRFAARTDGMLPELILGVWRAQFDNPEVLAFIDDIGLGPTIRGTDTLPESEIRRTLREYRGSIGAIEMRTCSVWKRKQPNGCGFLIGPNIVTTLSRVSGTDPGDIQMWFSMVRFNDRFLSEGQSARPHKRANLQKPPITERHAMEIDRPLGSVPVEESFAGSGATPRGWLTPITRVPIPGEPIFWLWRDNGVTFVSGTKVPSMDHVETLRIPAASAPLAAGAPCFDLNLNVVGMHDGSAILLF
jgi:hypothetical protein